MEMSKVAPLVTAAVQFELARGAVILSAATSRRFSASLTESADRSAHSKGAFYE